MLQYPNQFNIWRELTVYPVDSENAVTATSLRNSIPHVPYFVDEIIERSTFRMPSSPLRLKLIRTSILNLRIDRALKINGEAVLKRVQEIGAPCPPEAALTLRQEYSDQPYNEELIIVSEPQQFTDRYLRKMSRCQYMLKLMHNISGKQLNVVNVRHSNMLPEHKTIVFAAKE